MICKLCLKNPAIENSHIIPKFFHKPLKEEGHMVHSTSEHDRIEKIQDMWKEPLLCTDCDNRLLSKFEQYASQFFFHAPYKRKPDPLDAYYEVITDLDYKRLKLFTMSLLWRMGVSSLKDFSIVSLGPYEEKLRLMILTENPGKFDKYGCMLGGISFYKKPFLATLAPVCIKKDGYRVYSITVCGFVFNFIVSGNLNQFGCKDWFLRESGEWRIKKMNENHSFVNSILDQAVASLPKNSMARICANRR